MPNRSWQRLRSITRRGNATLPLRWVLVVPFVLQTVGAVSLVGYLSYRSGQQAIADLANQLMEETGNLVAQRLDRYFEAPRLTVQANAHALQAGYLNKTNLFADEPYFAHQLQLIPELSGLAIANENRAFVAVERLPQAGTAQQPQSKSLTIRRFNPADRGFYRYSADENGKNLILREVRQNFDPHNDPPGNPWYAEARRSTNGAWRSGVNLTQGQASPMLHLIYSLPFSDAAGKFQGVVSAGIYLTQLGNFLQNLSISKTGQVFLIDQDGMLVATSTEEMPFDRKPSSDSAQNVAVKPRRLSVAQSQNPLTRAAASYLLSSAEQTTGQTNPFAHLNQSRFSSFWFNRQQHFVRVVPLKGDLHWLAIVVMPESNFMSRIWGNARRTALLCLLTLLGSVVLGWLTARRITQPIVELNQANLALAKGVWQEPLSEATPIAELKTLTRSFNQTAQQLERALQASEAKTTDVLDSVTAAISRMRVFPDMTWQIDQVSAGSEAISGYTAEALTEDNNLWVSRIAPEDQQLIIPQVLADITAGRTGIYEYRFYRKDETLRWISQRNNSRWNEAEQCWNVSIVSVDITDRKQTEIALKQALQELNYHTENSPLATIRWDRLVQIKYWSKQAEQIFGWSAEEVVGRVFHEWQFVFEEDLDTVNETITQLLTGTGGVCLNRNYRKDGSIVFCEWYNSVLRDEDGNIVSILSLVKDVTERKRAEQELQQAKEAAEAANQAKSAFLSNMSHELRTPLHTILGFTQLVQRDSAISANQQKNLQLVYKSGNHLLKLINEILDLSKIEAGRLSLQNHAFNLFELLNSLDAMFSQGNSPVAFHLIILPNVPRSIVADSQKLQQVLINLIGNAVKFTQQGYVTLRVSAGSGAQESGVLAAAPSVMLHFEVEDSGIGIASPDLNLIFDAFAQASAGHQTQAGTGLGLTISRRLVQLMGGDITVSSILGQGSTFRFTVPVQPIAELAIAPAPEQRVIGLASGQRAYRILVVDDQTENRLLLVHLLGQVGLEVREAGTGKAAIAIWQQWQPDLIWMDVRMPELDGHEATRCIRAEERNREGIPPTVIIALTAHASENDRALALAAGCNDYASKPIREATLFDMMARHLQMQYIYG